ncbi:MAG: energy-coupling factor transporter transmembrane protein EcfT [Chloroflexi bacterium]|nr:energy-coupling factor transporter transmembrane protein EcfT [Chloroflexota bacterium]
MKSLPTGIFIPGDSPIHRLDSSIKLLALFITVVTIVLVNSFLGYVIMILFIMMIAMLSGISLPVALNATNKLYWFFIIILLMNTFFYSPEDAWFSFWVFTPSMTGFTYGLTVVLRVFLALVISNILTSTTPPMEITHALEHLISPFSYVGIPTGQIAMILSIAIQFIPTLAEETDTIRKAQMTRGARFDSKKITQKAEAVLPMVIPIFLAAFKRADELSVAMEARGYRGVSGRTKKSSRPLLVGDYGALLIVLLVCLLQIALRLINLTRTY